MNERILIVEDEANVRQLMERTLNGEGYRTAVAESAEEGLEILEQADGVDLLVTDALSDRPMIVVSDIRLPGMNGGEFARRVLRAWPGTRVLFVSGYGAQELVAKGVCPSDMPLLSKPFGPEALRRAVRETIALPPWCPAEWKDDP